MEGAAIGSPTTKGVQGLETKIDRLGLYDAWSKPADLQIETLVDPVTWQDYWGRLAEIKAKMVEAQAVAVIIKAQIADAQKAAMNANGLALVPALEPEQRG